MSSEKTHVERWSAIPSEQGIRKMVTPHAYRAGASCYKDGNILRARITGHELVASVREPYERNRYDYDDYDDDDYDDYDDFMAEGQPVHYVSLHQRGSSIESQCTCRTNLVFYGKCIHVVAVMLHLKDNMDKMVYEESTRLDKAEYIISRVPPENVMKFLAQCMYSNIDVMEDFIKEFHLEDVRPPRDYAMQIEMMHSWVRSGVHPGPLDFGDMLAEAQERQAKGDASESIKMYRDISKSIMNHAGTVDDQNGYYAECCIEAIDNMVESICRTDLPHEDKREYMEYLLDGTLTWEDAHIAPHYREALESICTSPEDLAFWEDLLTSCLKDTDTVSRVQTNMLGLPTRDRNHSARNLVNLVMMKIHILDETGRHDQSVNLLEEHALSDKNLCAMYLRALDRSDPETASLKAQEAMDAFPGDVTVMDAACLLLPDDGEEYADVVRTLFMVTGDWDRLYRLKKVSKDWESVMGGIVSDLAQSSPEKAVEACLKEKMRDKAMEILESAGGVEEFGKFHSKMAKRQPERYRAAYGRVLEKFIKSRSGKDHYERVAEHLAKIRAIPDDGDDDEYENLVRRIRKQNPRKRLLFKVLDIP